MEKEITGMTGGASYEPGHAATASEHNIIAHVIYPRPSMLTRGCEVRDPSDCPGIRDAAVVVVDAAGRHRKRGLEGGCAWFVKGFTKT
jgi:hypothetical protein